MTSRSSKALPLTQSEIGYVGPLTSKRCLCLLPINKKKRKQKVIVGDERGMVCGFQIKRGEIQDIFKAFVLGAPVTCISLGFGKGAEYKIYIATPQMIVGITQKGKEVFRFQSNLSEDIKSIHFHEKHLCVATDSILNVYEDGVDKHTFACTDRINDMLAADVPNTDAFFSIIGCQDGFVRIIQGSSMIIETYADASVTNLCAMQCTIKQLDVAATLDLVIANAAGGIGLYSFDGVNISAKWKIALADTNAGMINSIALFNDKEIGLQIVAGFDCGRIEVVACDESSNIAKLCEYAGNDSVRTVRAAIYPDSEYSIIFASTFSGRIFSLSTETCSNLEDNYRAYHGPHKDARLQKLRKEVQALQDKVNKEQNASKEKDVPKIADEVPVNSIFQLKPQCYYDLSIEVPIPMESLVLHSTVPIEVLSSKENLSIMSSAGTFTSPDTHYLASFRCPEETTRLDLKIRTIEGHCGEIEVTILVATLPPSAVTVRHYIKPLSLHQRIISIDACDAEHAMNTVNFSGDFTLSQMHDWISQCFVDVPPRMSDDEMNLYYRHTLLKSFSICRYRKGEASILSPSVSVIAIIKDFIAKEATKRKITINISLEVRKESAELMLEYIRPVLELQHTTSTQAKIMEAVKELQTHDTEYTEWMAPELQAVNMNLVESGIMHEPTPITWDVLSGFITDLYVDMCKFQGAPVTQNLPTLCQLIERNDFDGLLDLFVQM